MRNTVFTICTKNYIGLCDVLFKSIKKYNDDIDCYIFVADEMESISNALDRVNILIAKDVLDIELRKWYDMAFKYDLTEFCTAIKPFCFQYLFRKIKSQKVIYFDPDIFVVNSLNSIWELLDTKDVVLTPHVTTLQINYTGDLNERNLLHSGLYNCGFIALKNTQLGLNVIDWWGNRLMDFCYRSESESMFTDQKWIDFIPSLLPQEKYEISFNLGYNLAPWNFYEREVVKKGDDFFIKNRLSGNNEIDKLTFIHFSGYNYKELLNNNIVQKNITHLQVRDDLVELFNDYSTAILNSSFDKYINYTYTYNYFENGKSISSIHRRIYRRMLYDHVQYSESPFKTTRGSFYDVCEKHKMILSTNMDSLAKKEAADIRKNVGKIYVLNILFKLLYKLLGAQKYFMFVRLLRMYGKFENHVFLLNNEYMKKVSYFK